jgi:hypothetical protein
MPITMEIKILYSTFVCILLNIYIYIYATNVIHLEISRLLNLMFELWVTHGVKSKVDQQMTFENNNIAKKKTKKFDMQQCE